MLSKEAKKELKIVLILFSVVVSCWAAYNLKKESDNRAREKCYDVCTQTAIQSLIKAKLPDKKIMAQVDEIKQACEQECN